MAASTEQKLDYLLKKIGYTASKTGLAEDSSLSGTKKAPFAEAIPSPLVTPSTTIWNESALIPTTPPGSDTAQVRVYLAGTSGHRMTVDSTVSGSRAFIAYSTYNDTSSGILGDWIDPQFGDAYIIKVYKGDPNSGGTLLSAAGAGSNDTWFFDYSSGVLNFNGTVIPSGVTDTNIYIVGYRYIGVKGLSTSGITTSGTSTFKDLNVTGVSTFAGNINANGNIVGDNATNISGINSVTATSLFANLTGNVSGIATYTSEWIVTSNGSSDYRFTGPGFDGTENDPTIYLARGQQYKFTNHMGAHPFQIRTAINGSAYNDGVVNNGVSNGTLTWDVQMDAPNVLYYQCTAHAGMVGKIYIGNSGNSINVGSGVTITSATSTFKDLSVTGVSTFTGNINANGDILGDSGTNISGMNNVSATSLTGTLASAAQPNITSVGTLSSLNVTGDVSIGGTLTYEDVTNIDSVGLITARTGIKVLAGGINAVGVVTANSFDGSLATTNLTGTITNAQLAGSIANDKLANSTVSYGGISLALGETDATPAFNLTDATNYPFTSLTGITTVIFGDATPKLGGDLNGNSKNIFGVGISSASAFADFDYLQAPFGSTTTFTVTVASKDATHRYNGTGSGNAYLINGVQAPILSLTPGRTYRFTNDNTGSHPLKFYYKADKTTEYTTGVSFQNSYTEITISDTTPNVLHYQCTAHAYMGNAVITNSNVVDSPYAATLRDSLTVTNNINANGNIVGDNSTNISGINSVTATTYFGNLTGNVTGNADTATTATNINVTANNSTNEVVYPIFVDGATGSQGAETDTNLYYNPSSNELHVGAINVNTLTASLNILANGNIVGDNATNISGINSVTATTYFGDGTKLTGVSTAGISTEGTTSLNNLEVAGVSTFAGLAKFNGNFEAAGNVTLGDGTGDNIDVQGRFVRELVPSSNGDKDLGTSSFRWGTLHVRNILQSGGGISTIQQLNVTGVSTFVGIVTFQNVDINQGTIDGTNIGFNHRANGQFINLDAQGTLDVDGTSTLNNVSVAGVSTFTGTIDANGNLDVDGQTELDNVNISGVTTTGNITITANSPSIVFKETDANPDYQIKTQSGIFKIKDSGGATFFEIDSNGTVDIKNDLGVSGISTFSDDVTFQTANTNNLVLDKSDNSLKFGDSVRAKFGASTDMEIYHTTASGGTNFIKGTGNLTLQSNVIVLENQSGNDAIRIDGAGGAVKIYHPGSGEKLKTTNDGVDITGIATATDFSGNISGVGATFTNITGTLQTAAQPNITSLGTLTSLNVTGDVSIGGTLTYEDVTNIDSVGIVTARTGIKVLAGGINAVGVVTGTNGLSGTILTAAQTNITSVGTLGALTVSGNINANGNIIGDNATNISGINSVTATTYFGDGTKLIGVSTAGITTSGTSVFKNLSVTGVSTFTGNINANGNIVGDNSTNISGINSVTATSFHGDGSGLTNLPASTPDKIEEGDSKVEVTDSGTGQINVVIDGSHFARFTNVSGRKAIFGSNVSVQNNYGTNDGDIIIANGGRRLRLFRTGVGLADDSIIGTIDFAAQQSGTGGQSVSLIQSSLRESVENKSDLIFSTSNGGSPTEKLRIRATGNVGIATTNPTSKLHVVGNALVTGVLTATSFSGDGSGLTNVGVDTATVSANSVDTGTLNVTGISTLVGFSTFNSGIFVAGISTFSNQQNAINVVSTNTNPAINVSLGGTVKGSIIPALDGLEIGATSANHISFRLNRMGGNTSDFIVKTVDDELFKIDSGTRESTFISTDTSSSAGPVINLYRNSPSPADADYLGQIKFQGESDTGVQRNYAKITGKILDASNGTEDGIIEFAHIKAGSQTITGRFRSDSLQLLNGTALSVAGDITANGNIAGDGSTNITGINEITVAGNINANGNIVGDNATNISGINSVTASAFYGDGSNLSNVGFTTSVGTFNASSGVATIDSFAYATEDYKVAEYTLHFTNGSDIQAQKLLVMQDGSTAYSQEFAVMSSASQLVSLDAIISGSNVLVRATPESGISGTTTFRWRRIVQE